MKQAVVGWIAGSLVVFAAATMQAQTAPQLAEFPKLSAATDWPWWRGPRRDGHAEPAADPPTAWSETQNVVWKTPVPGRGHSSPTVVGNRVYLTTADEAPQVQSVLAFDKASGKPLWKTDLSQGGFPKTHPKNTHATPTVACDGERLFVTFHHHDTLQAAALDFDGRVVWNQSLGTYRPDRYKYGYAPSPIPYRETVIIAAEFDGPSYIAAFDRRTGKQVWRTPRAENISFSSPAILPVGGRDLLAISGAGKVACYDPATGRPLWAVDATTAATCGTIVADGDLLFASGGYPDPGTYAIKVVGQGGEVLWKNREKCYEQSMITVDGYLYALTDQGVLYCFRENDGREMWRERLRGPVSASPVYAGGHIYWSNELGTTYVFRPNPERCEMIAENQLGDESFASPAVVGRQLFLRVASSETGTRQEFLYCLGK